VSGAAREDPFADLDRFEAALEVERILEWLRDAVHRHLGRRGAVVGVSGGVDSAVVTALCARAFGPENVLAVLSPERDSAADTLALSLLAAGAAGVPVVEEELTEVLDAFGCYRRRDEAVAGLVPGFTSEWKLKVVLPSPLAASRLPIFTLVAESPEEERVERRLPAEAYRTLVAATSFKQRARKTLEYFHADRLGFAVAGTPNRLEFDQGFFVKNGDGSADVKPIAHLYKTQVYALAEELGVPEEICGRVPTTDTYALEQTQEEFFFGAPLRTLDLCLFARDRGITTDETAAASGLAVDQVERLFAAIDAKRRAARYLHLEPLVLDLD
jgi:NAD+ synthase